MAVLEFPKRPEQPEVTTPWLEKTIYLDLDGVIIPYEGTGHESFDPKIISRLGEIGARGVSILPSSSRSLDVFLYKDYKSIYEGIGSPDTYLVIDRFQPAHIGYKAEAVLNNFRGIVDIGPENRGWERSRSMVARRPLPRTENHRAVWIDDHATRERLEHWGSPRALEALEQPHLRVVNPLGHIGLTLSQLDEVETFLFDD